VGRMDLFWASHVIIFLGQHDVPLSLHGAAKMSNFSGFGNQLITRDSAINPTIIETN
jgi:hypothetical protein